MMKETVYCRIAPSLGMLEDTPENIWGTPEYEGDKDSPTVFFGLYGLPDFYALWRHKGKKWILWAGSDIRHFINGYWLDEEGKTRISSLALAEWIRKNCESWVENDDEREALLALGIESSVSPSFLGDSSKFPISYQWSAIPRVYTSISGDDFQLYGWDKIDELASRYSFIEFHLYGSKKKFSSPQKNVMVHGRVSKEQMNEEIKSMQGALRLVHFEGFSEIIAKSILMGQWPVSVIPYPHILSLDELGTLPNKKEVNLIGRSYYLQTLNSFPWNSKKDNFK